MGTSTDGQSVQNKYVRYVLESGMLSTSGYSMDVVFC